MDQADRAPLRRSWIVASGIRTPVIEAGPEGAAEAAVFVHGNPGSSIDWHDLIARVGTFGRAVAFDMPGFGNAAKPADFPYSVLGYAGFISDALGELAISRVHLAVHDFGGPFGLAWAASAPDSFASAVLINTPPVSHYRWYLLAKIWRTPGAGEVMHLTLTRPFFELNVRRGRGRPLPHAFVDRMWRDYDRGTRRAVLELYRASDAYALVPAPPEFFRRLARPAIVVWGRRDAYIPPRFAEAHLDAFPGAAIAYLEESGHWPMIDDPSGTARAVIPFLRRQFETGRRTEKK